MATRIVMRSLGVAPSRLEREPPQPLRGRHASPNSGLVHRLALLGRDAKADGHLFAIPVSLGRPTSAGWGHGASVADAGGGGATGGLKSGLDCAGVVAGNTTPGI